MTMGMETYQRFKHVEKQANEMGFAFRSDPYGRSRDAIFLTPLNKDSLPVFHETATMFSGSLDQVKAFLEGIEWAQRYDLALGLKTDKRREKAEQRVRNKRLIDILKGKNNA
jgi:hypothetical protein